MAPTKQFCESLLPNRAKFSACIRIHVLSWKLESLLLVEHLEISWPAPPRLDVPLRPPRNMSFLVAGTRCCGGLERSIGSFDGLLHVMLG